MLEVFLNIIILKLQYAADHFKKIFLNSNLLDKMKKMFISFKYEEQSFNKFYSKILLYINSRPATNFEYLNTFALHVATFITINITVRLLRVLETIELQKILFIITKEAERVALLKLGLSKRETSKKALEFKTAVIKFSISLKCED